VHEPFARKGIPRQAQTKLAIRELLEPSRS